MKDSHESSLNRGSHKEMTLATEDPEGERIPKREDPQLRILIAKL
jgi:hypothetical protein